MPEGIVFAGRGGRLLEDRRALVDPFGPSQSIPAQDLCPGVGGCRAALQAISLSQSLLFTARCSLTSLALIGMEGAGMRLCLSSR